MKKGLFLNEDFGNFIFGHPESEMNENGIRKQITYYTEKGGVGTLIYNMNCRTAMFDSKILDTFGDGVTEELDESSGVLFTRNQALRNHRTLIKNCDPFPIRRKACSEAGVDLWYSVRMNDIHWTYKPEYPQHGNTWRKRVDLRRAAYRGDRCFWNDHGWDYGIDEVRRIMLAFIEEILTRGEPDGLELDWMRTPPHFKPGMERQSIPLVNDFMREVKKMCLRTAEKLGHPVEIGVRLPVWPEESLEMGLDVFAWAKEGLIDAVFPTGYYQTTEPVPVYCWKRILPERIVVAPVLESHVCSAPEVPQMMTTSEIDRGFAGGWLYDGADSIYLFNHMDGKGVRDTYGADKLQEDFPILGSLDQDSISRFIRRIPAVYHESFVEGVPDRPCLTKRAWMRIHTLRLNIGKISNGRAEVILGFDHPVSLPEVRLNTVLLNPAQDTVLPPLPEDTFYQGYSVPEEALHDGEAILEFEHPEDCTLRWAEIRIFPFREIF